MPFQLFPARIVTNPNTSRHVMLVEVRSVPHDRIPRPRQLAGLPITAEYISGFSGSAGTAVVSLTNAALSTDGRYFNQAAKQLDDNWLLLKRGLEGVPTWQEWYALCGKTGRTGVD